VGCAKGQPHVARGERIGSRPADWPSPRAQATLGWNVEVSLDPARHVEVRTRMAGAEVSGVAVHPLGRAPEQTLVFRPMAGGYVSQAPLPPGRYRVRVEIMSAGRTADFLAEVSGG